MNTLAAPCTPPLLIDPAVRWQECTQPSAWAWGAVKKPTCSSARTRRRPPPTPPRCPLTLAITKAKQLPNLSFEKSGSLRPCPLLGDSLPAFRPISFSGVCKGALSYPLSEVLWAALLAPLVNATVLGAYSGKHPLLTSHTFVTSTQSDHSSGPPPHRMSIREAAVGVHI